MTASLFQLHPQLSKDCEWVCDLPLSRILLLDDSQYPWFVQVPRVADIREIVELSIAQQDQLWRESRALSEGLISLFKPDKLNVAALGNMVPQLHIHHIARFIDDPAWPKPVWGVAAAMHYAENEKRQTIDNMQRKLKETQCW